MVFVIDDDLQTYTEQNYREFETQNNVVLPNDYKQFMSEFGSGIYCDFLKLHPLEDVLSKTAEARETWQEYPEFFWPHSNKTLTLEAALNCFALAESVNSDILAFDPKSEEIVIFPRDDEDLFFLKGDFKDPTHWPEKYMNSILEMEKTFWSSHNLTSKTLILEKKKKYASQEGVNVEFLSHHIKSIKDLHSVGQTIGISYDDMEILYSKRWAGQVFMTKFSTKTGERVRVNLDFNKRNLSLVENDLDILYSLRYKIIKSENS